LRGARASRAARRPVRSCHDDDAIGEPQRFVDIMRDEDDGRAELAVNAPQLVLQRGADDRVDGAEGLVHQQHGGFARERPRDACALLLTARERAGQAVAIARGFEAYEREQLVDARGDARCVPAQQLRHDRDVLPDREMREEPDRLDRVADPAPQLRARHARNVTAVDLDRAAARDLEPVERPQERAFAAARGAEQHDELTRRDVEGVDGERVAIGAGVPDPDVADDDRRAAHTLACPARKSRATSAGSRCRRSTSPLSRRMTSSVSSGASASSAAASVGLRRSASARTTGAA